MNEFEAGRKAEEFFHRYRGHLVNTMHVGMTRTEGNVGGSDVHSLGASNFVDSGMNDGRTELKAQQSFFCKTEVKAIRNKTFLSRDNNSEEPTGTVEFEMWSRDTDTKETAPRKRFSPPSADEVSTYCRERGNTVDAEQFCNFYASKGWRVGSQPMRDWKAAVRTWEKREGSGHVADRRISLDEL